MRAWLMMALAFVLVACGETTDPTQDNDAPPTEVNGEKDPPKTDPPKTDPRPEEASPPTSIPSGMAGVPDIKILKVHKVGSGPKCGRGKTARVKYRAMLLNGQVVDPGARPFEFPVGKRRAIVGWDITVAAMRVGDSWTVHVPYQLAYPGGRPGIPPRTDMKFDMELLSFR